MVRQLPPPHLKPIPIPPPPPPPLPATTHRFSSDLVGHHYTGAVGDKLIPAIPGFRTSAAFLTSLSANLRLGDDDLMPSPMSTPPSMRESTSGLPLPPPSPLSFSTSSALSGPPATRSPAEMSSANPFNTQPASSHRSLPSLETYIPSDEHERIDGLKLVADSVAQQRQVASRMLIFNPLHIAVYIGVLGLLVQKTYRGYDDLMFIITTGAGITMAFLIAVRWATGGYLYLAEDIGWDWVGDDTLVVSKWGEEIIGSLVMGWETDASPAKKRGGRGRRKGKALVRAWTVKLRYRRKGIGEGLLEEAVRIASEKGAEGIEFAEETAYSRRILPRFYNAFLDKRDRQAKVALEKIANEKGNFGRRSR